MTEDETTYEEIELTGKEVQEIVVATLLEQADAYEDEASKEDLLSGADRDKMKRLRWAAGEMRSIAGFFSKQRTTYTVSVPNTDLDEDPAAKDEIPADAFVNAEDTDVPSNFTPIASIHRDDEVPDDTEATPKKGSTKKK